MRKKSWAFVAVVSLVLMHQFLFTTAYSKAPNFIAQWFFTAALTGLASYALGLMVFGDKLSFVSSLGLVVIFIGLAMLKFG